MTSRRFWAATIAFAALFGCSKPGIEPDPPIVEEPVPEEIPISFATYLVHTTKGPVTTSDIIKAEGAGLGISAVYAKDTLWSDIRSRYPAFMYNQQILWDGEKWDYSPPKFWPTIAGEKISFFAYAPYNCPGVSLCDTTSMAADPSRLHFRIAEKSNETVDFVATCIIDGTGTYEDPRVMLELKPELTRVEMSAKVDEDLYSDDGQDRKTRVIVKSARFTGPKVYHEGEYIFNTESPADIGSWDFSAQTAADYPIQLKGEDFILETNTPYHAEKAIVLTSYHAEYQLLTDSAPDENYIFLLPPADDIGIEEGDISVIFDYDILTEDPKLPSGYACISSTKTVALPSGTLKQGCSYRFTFRFCLNRIEVSATIVPSNAKSPENR